MRIAPLALCVLARAGAPAAVGPRKVEPTAPVYRYDVEDGWLTMRDGVRLSVTYVKPVPRSPGETFPVLFDLYP